MGGRLCGSGWGLLLLTILMVSGASAMGATFHSCQYGYNLTVPDGWQEIPPAVLQRFVRQRVKRDPKSLFVCDTAFQYKPRDRWFEEPYIIVQVKPYSKPGVHHRIDERDFQMIARAFARGSDDKPMDRDLSGTGRSLMSDPRFAQTGLDLSRRRFQRLTTTSVKGQGIIINGMIVTYFGNEDMVKLRFFGKEAQWEQQFAAAQPVLDSLHFDPDKDFAVAAPEPPAAIEPPPVIENPPVIEYPLATVHPSAIDDSPAIEHSLNQPTWLDVAEKGFAGGVAVLVIGAICFVVMQFLKSKA